VNTQKESAMNYFYKKLPFNTDLEDIIMIVDFLTKKISLPIEDIDNDLYQKYYDHFFAGKFNNLYDFTRFWIQKKDILKDEYITINLLKYFNDYLFSGNNPKIIYCKSGYYFYNN
jgi:hypothetical protein